MFYMNLEVAQYEMYCFNEDRMNIIKFDAPAAYNACEIIEQAGTVLSWFSVDAEQIGKDIHIVKSDTNQVIV